MKPTTGNVETKGYFRAFVDKIDDYATTFQCFLDDQESLSDVSSVDEAARSVDASPLLGVAVELVGGQIESFGLDGEDYVSGQFAPNTKITGEYLGIAVRQEKNITPSGDTYGKWLVCHMLKDPDIVYRSMDPLGNMALHGKANFVHGGEVFVKSVFGAHDLERLAHNRAFHTIRTICNAEVTNKMRATTIAAVIKNEVRNSKDDPRHVGDMYMLLSYINETAVFSGAQIEASFAMFESDSSSLAVYDHRSEPLKLIVSHVDMDISVDHEGRISLLKALSFECTHEKHGRVSVPYNSTVDFGSEYIQYRMF